MTLLSTLGVDLCGPRAFSERLIHSWTASISKMGN